MNTPRNMVKTALRVPVVLHQRIHEEARKNGRSFNAEIVFRMTVVYSATETEKEARQ